MNIMMALNIVFLGNLGETFHLFVRSCSAASSNPGKKRKKSSEGVCAFYRIRLSAFFRSSPTSACSNRGSSRGSPHAERSIFTSKYLLTKAYS